MNIKNIGFKKIVLAFKTNENIDLNFTLDPNVGLVFTASQVSIRNPKNKWGHYNQGISISGVNYALNSVLQLLIRKKYYLSSSSTIFK